MDNSRSAGVSGSTPNSARPVQVDYTPRYLNTMIGTDIQLDIDDDGYADLRANEARTALVDSSGAEYYAIDPREETPGSIFWFLPTDCTASLGWFQLGLIVRESSNLEQMAFESEDTIWLEGLNSACYLTS